MTETLADTIGRFVAQAQFGVWIFDMHGVTVFANRKLNDLFGIPERTDALLGLDLSRPGSFQGLDFSGMITRASRGETTDCLMHLRDIRGEAKRPARILEVLGYPLHAPSGETEHVVLLFEDVSQAHEERERSRKRLAATPGTSQKDARARIAALRRDEMRLMEKIRAQGADPATE